MQKYCRRMTFSLCARSFQVFAFHSAVFKDTYCTMRIKGGFSSSFSIQAAGYNLMFGLHRRPTCILKKLLTPPSDITAVASKVKANLTFPLSIWLILGSHNLCTKRSVMSVKPGWIISSAISGQGLNGAPQCRGLRETRVAPAASSTVCT